MEDRPPPADKAHSAVEATSRARAERGEEKQKMGRRKPSCFGFEAKSV
jgi:hypothetical protein